MADKFNPEYNEQRAIFFRLLSVLFCYPEPETQNILINLTDRSSFFQGDFSQKAKELSSIFKSTELLELQKEYTKLFLGPSPNLVPPYGSIYIEESGRVHDESTQAVSKYYELMEMNVVENEPPDHISIELEFLYFLASKTEKEEIYKHQKNFLENYVLSWFEKFNEAVTDSKHSSFYSHLTDLTSHFLEKDLNYLNNVGGEN